MTGMTGRTPTPGGRESASTGWEVRVIQPEDWHVRHRRLMVVPRSRMQLCILGSIGLHMLLGGITAFKMQERYTPRPRIETIPIQLSGVPKPPATRTIERVKQATPEPPKETIEHPRAIPEPKKPKDTKPKATKDKPAEARQPRKAPEKAVDETPKPGTSEPSLTQRSKMPAVGEDNGLMLQVQGQRFEYDYYLKLVHKKISDRWDPPTLAESKQGSVSATVMFRIQRDGTIEAVMVDEPSGSTLFDRASLRAVQDAAPFPPLPTEFTGEWIGIQLRFNLAT